MLAMTAQRRQAQSNVTIQVKNGSLQVTGQNNSTQCLLVTPTGVPGQYEFSMPPLDNGAATLFNGETSLIVSGVTGDMRFDLKSGRKMLILSNTELGGNSAASPDFVVPRSLKISSSGSSPATMILNKVRTSGSAEITTKNGSDAILLMHCFLAANLDLPGNVKINSGGGNDVLLVSDSYMRQCDINMGSGNDHLLMQDGFVGFQAKFNLGSGNDQVAFLGSFGMNFFGPASFNGGRGFDHIAEFAAFYPGASFFYDTFSFSSFEDQTSLNPNTIYDNAVNTNATFGAADDIYFNLIGF